MVLVVVAAAVAIILLSDWLSGDRWFSPSTQLCYPSTRKFYSRSSNSSSSNNSRSNLNLGLVVGRSLFFSEYSGLLPVFII